MKDLPAAWETRTLADVADVRLGRQRSPKNHSGEHMRPYLRAANVDWHGLNLDDVKEMNFSDSEMDTYRLQPGDILLSEASGSANEAGKPAMWSGEIADCAFQNTLLRVRSHGPEPRYLLHWFRKLAINGEFASRSRGVGIHHIGRATLASWPVPVPPIEEQRRIVDILETHLSHLEAGLHTIEATQLRLNALWLSALRQFRDRAAAAAGPLRSLGEVAKTDLGKMLDAKRAVGEPTPYLRNINVRWGEFDLSDVRTVPLTDHERSDFAVQRDDVLVCEGGEPGRCAIWESDEPIAYQKALHRVRVLPDAGMSTEFLAMMLEEYVRTGRANALFNGTTIKHLPQEKLRSVLIPVPDAGEQRAAVMAASELAAECTRMRAALSSAVTRAGQLRRALLQAAFSGRLAGSSSDLDRAEESIA